MAGHRHGRSWRRLVAGVGLVAVSGVAGVVGLLGTSAAVAEDDAEEVPVAIEASTLYVSPLTDAIPPTLTKSIPPAAVCVLQPDLCPESSEPIRNALRDGLGLILDNAQDLPVQPVPPDTAAVSYFGGHVRYQTAILFDTPDVPEGEELISFSVRFPQTQPSYDVNSPLFRGVFLAVFEFLGSGQDPAVLGEELASALEESPIEVDGNVIGIEACPLLAPFEPGGAPLASDYREMPTREEDDSDVPDVDCIIGSGGVFDETTEEWVFDLAFAVNAWNEGELENNGVLLRPTGAPNLAFGDPDTSTMAQVVLDLESVTGSAVAVEAFDPDDLEPIDTAPIDEGFEDEPFVEDDLGFDEGGFDPGGAPLDAGGDFGGDVPALDDPAVADAPDPGAAPEVAPDEVDVQAIGLPTGPEGGPAWWVWLLVPAFLGGAYLTSTALLAPAGAPGATQSGALTRLLAARAGPPPATGV